MWLIRTWSVTNSSGNFGGWSFVYKVTLRQWNLGGINHWKNRFWLPLDLYLLFPWAHQVYMEISPQAANLGRFDHASYLCQSQFILPERFQGSLEQNPSWTCQNAATLLVLHGFSEVERWVVLHHPTSRSQLRSLWQFSIEMGWSHWCL